VGKRVHTDPCKDEVFVCNLLSREQRGVEKSLVWLMYQNFVLCSSSVIANWEEF
jgi:hypothetical protein